MSRMREDLDISVRVLKRLAVPHHTLRSWMQVAKREKLSDDKVVRSFTRVEELVGGKLTEVRDNRLVPTVLGQEYRIAAERILCLDQGETIEVFTVATSPGVDPLLVARAIIEFSKEWGSLVGFSLLVIPQGIRQAVESNQVAFGIVGAGEVVDADESLRPALPLVALIPDDHRLAASDGPLDREHFSPSDRVFYAPSLAGTLGGLLARVPALNRLSVECPETLRMLVGSGVGIGFEFSHAMRRDGDTFARVPVFGVGPLTLGLVLPSRKDRLSEPALYFLEILRRGPELVLPPIPSLELPLPELQPLPETLRA